MYIINYKKYKKQKLENDVIEKYKTKQEKQNKNTKIVKG